LSLSDNAEMICSLALTCQFCTQAEHVYPVILANSASGWLMNMLYFGIGRSSAEFSK